jgi:hypothetical protein
MVTVSPPMVRIPLRPIELVFPAIVQFNEVPTTVTEAQATFEPAVGGAQPADVDSVMVPAPPVPAATRAYEFKVYGQMPV